MKIGRQNKTPFDAPLAESSTTSWAQRLRTKLLGSTVSDNPFELSSHPLPKRDPFRLAGYVSALLLLVGVLVWLGSYFSHRFTNSQSPLDAKSTQHQNVSVQQRASQPLPRVASQTAAISSNLPSDGKPNVSSTSSHINPEAILTAPIPDDSAIAKEELDRLDDQYLQLSEQEALLQAQLAVMNSLEEKKAERIRLLEQQIALLEQQQANPSNPPPVAK